MKDESMTKEQLILELAAMRQRVAELEKIENERKRAEEAWQESEASYRELADSIADIFFAMDKDLRYTYWNKASEELTGISAQDAIGKALYELFPDTPEARIAGAKYLEVLRTQQPQHFVNEFQLRGKDYIFEISAYPSKGGLSVFTKDITERKQAEEELGERTRLSRIILDNIPCVALLLKPGTREIIISNEEAVKVGAVRGTKCFETWRQRKEPCPWCLAPEVWATGEVRHLEVDELGITWDAHWIPISQELYMHYAFDITERKREEEELRKYRNDLEQLVEDRTAELRMINKQLQEEITDRQRAEEALYKSKKRYQLLFNSGSDALFVHGKTKEGMLSKFVEVNDVACQRLGYTREELLKLSPLDINLPEYLGQIPAVIEKLFADKHTLVERMHVGKDGKRIPVEINMHLFELDGQQLIISIARDISDRKQVEEELKKYRKHLEDLVEERTTELRKANEQLQQDITERKRAEEALQETSETLRALIQASPLAIIALDVERNVKIWNRAAERIFGWGQQEVIGRPIPIVSEDKQEEFRSFYNRVSRGKEITGLELRRQKKDGSFIDVSLSTAPFYNAKGDVIGNMGVLDDITEHKKAEEKIHTYQKQLRSLASELSLAEERERRRIAIDLHDHIGQTLAICKIKLGELRELASSTNLAKSLGEINELIGETIKYTRSLTFDLSPPILYELGFEAAVEWLTEQIQEQHNILVEFMDDGKPKPMDEEIRVLLFKAVRELLVNVVKHAQARKVKVSIQKDEGELRISVQDDGVGFDSFEVSSNLGRSGGFGFFSIRERLRHLGCRFEVESEPGLGTRVSIGVPLAQKYEEKVT